MTNKLTTLLMVSSLTMSLSALANQCTNQKIELQVLGSGGPQLNDGRASSSYLIWADNKAKVLVDTGSGSSINFGKAKANFKDLEAILLTHLHVDHSSDLPAYIKGSVFTDRIEDMKLLGPKGNSLMPSIESFVESMMGKEGAYRYLNGYFIPWGRNYTLEVVSADISHSNIQKFKIIDNISTAAVSVKHGPLPAVAWRVDIGGCNITFSGDMNGTSGVLEKLAANTDILVAHNAVPETANGGEGSLHMTPSTIGKIAKKANVKQLVLSHRMTFSLGKEPQTLKAIAKHYKGKVTFANDLDKFTP